MLGRLPPAEEHLDRWNAVLEAWPTSRFLPTTDLELIPAHEAAIKKGLYDWRMLVPVYLQRFEDFAGLDGQVYCFGVAHGGTVRTLTAGFRYMDRRIPHLHLFDSFQGLPAESPGSSTPPIWHVGAFASPIEELEGTLGELELTPADYSIHDGWFSDTLSARLVKDGTFRPALYVDLDVDLYGSSMDSLGFLFEHNLIRAGTLIGYDDWGDTDLWTAGESRAHKELTERYGACCAQLFSIGEPPLIRKLFLVVSV